MHEKTDTEILNWLLSKLTHEHDNTSVDATCYLRLDLAVENHYDDIKEMVLSAMWEDR